ncbi:MAG: hypothetical protein ACPGU1_14580 [Myxococcota bacterium]
MSMIPPGPYLESTTPPWSRLQRSGHFVGFKRSVGKTQLFSEDGYAWSGSPIDYDRALRETGLKDAQAQRVFHGDLVSIRLSSGDEAVPRVVLLDAADHVFLGDPSDGSMRPLDAYFPASQRPHIMTVEGSVFARSEARRPHVGSFRRFGFCRAEIRRDAVILACAIFLTTAALGLAQWLLTGSAGPLIGMLGATLGCLGFYVVRRRRAAGWLSRARILSMVPTTALCLGLASAAARGLSCVETAADGPLAVSMLGLGILGGLVGLVLPMVIGDALGFARED